MGSEYSRNNPVLPSAFLHIVTRNQLISDVEYPLRQTPARESPCGLDMTGTLARFLWSSYNAIQGLKLVKSKDVSVSVHKFCGITGMIPIEEIHARFSPFLKARLCCLVAIYDKPRSPHQRIGVKFSKVGVYTPEMVRVLAVLLDIRAMVLQPEPTIVATWQLGDLVGNKSKSVVEA
ncbi:predicted protein [Histoplasma capsulatum var. duboisii H88]|uniref:Predicted protein n=1 Tax=Ajellomyces capsulatus (strain H88) TaxID=544711 RepID=F0UAP7_AJEC8|nr:predicted protein [Histoplasma capsulatum var. duboisii H88]